MLSLPRFLRKSWPSGPQISSRSRRSSSAPMSQPVPPRPTNKTGWYSFIVPLFLLLSESASLLQPLVLRRRGGRRYGDRGLGLLVVARRRRRRVRGGGRRGRSAAVPVTRAGPVARSAPVTGAVPVVRRSWRTRRGHGLGRNGAARRARARPARVPGVAEGELEPVLQGLPGAVDLDLVRPQAHRRRQPDQAAPGSPDLVDSRTPALRRVVQPWGSRVLVADDEGERLGPLPLWLKIAA